GTLLLSMPEAPHGLRMPIDAFLRSLAEDRGENSLGIVLSGTGTDGTLGLRAILGSGGVAMVQDPASAKFDGMPMSAIKAGYATQILPPERMPEALLTDVRILAMRHNVPGATRDDSAIDRVLAMLRAETGHDFSQYKRSTIGRRMERRMAQ